MEASVGGTYPIVNHDNTLQPTRDIPLVAVGDIPQSRQRYPYKLARISPTAARDIPHGLEGYLPNRLGGYPYAPNLRRRPKFEGKLPNVIGL